MKLCERLGIELPIIQAPMAGAQGSMLTIAVSNAGGLGSLPCAMLSAEALAAELKEIRGSTDKPYNLNFFCHQQPQPDEAREQAWRDRLGAYYAEYGIDARAIQTGAGRAPFSAELADLIEPYRPPVISFHFGLPAPELVERIKGWGTLVFSSATTVEEALWLEQHGADAIIAQGLEAGGHRGMFLSDDLTTQVGTFALLPQIVQAVSCPVIAAGGIADAQGVAAALSLGAQAVQLGTAYLCCPETKISAIHRAALQSEAARHTALTNIFSGRPARGIVNRAIHELGPICTDAPAFPLASTAITPLRSVAEKQGSGDFSPLWAGQNASQCREIPAAELTRLLSDS
ncbi:NAD(P)H-dependent flavin oxidoreductase [Marinobacterium sp. YM272]|uniref:NAD(P)H-dependent flavin oxidoreductase n=1 Tax=Marinobacterium sp. YM272 TaxID=3421654 RepID=UPI003D7F5047